MTYSKKIIELFEHPKNVGEIKNADGIGEVTNPDSCGDVMFLYIKVSKAKSGKYKGKEIIKDVKFKTYGCAAAIASSSIITEMAKGKPLEDVENLSRKDIEKKLGGLPKIKEHCADMAARGLKAAIDDYRKKKGKE